MSLIDPEIVKAIASRALGRRGEETHRALADAQPVGRCAGPGCAKPAEFTLTGRDGGRHEFCRDHLLAFAAADAADPAVPTQPGVLTASPPQR